MSQKILRDVESLKPVISGKKFLLVRSGAYDSLDIKRFFERIPHVEFSNFTPNPLYQQVCEGVDVFNEEKCEMIVAVGGGSTIDVAKCIKLYCRMDHSTNYLKQEAFDSKIPLIAVPTTAGTGSESTQYAVIYFEGMKQSVSHASIVPDYAVLEPSVLKKLSAYQKKCTMMDALCQAIESWWSVHSTEESRGYSRKAITGIKMNWKDYIENNTDRAASEILTASNYAGRAINITATTAAHAMSYKITSLYNFPHGHAVSVCMQEVWKYMQEHTEYCIDLRGEGYLRKTLGEISELMDLDYYCGLLRKLALGYPLSDNRQADIEVLTASVNPTRLRNNPIELSTGVLREMYERIVKS